MSLKIPKIYLLFLIIFSLVITFFIIFINIPRKSPEQATTNQKLTPVPVSQRGNSPIKARTINPPEDTSGTTILNPSQEITYDLSKTISTSDVSVTINPSLPIKVRSGNNPNTLIIVPDPPYYWKPDVLYTVTLRDNEGKTITTYSIKVPRIKLPDVVD